MKKRKAYRTKKMQLAEWNQLAEKLTAKYAVLFGIERVGGYTDADGKVYPPAFNCHVDGFCFRVDSVACGVSLLQGFDAGMEFNVSVGSGRGCVSRGEVEQMIREAFETSEGRKGAKVPKCEARHQATSPSLLV